MYVYKICQQRELLQKVPREETLNSNTHETARAVTMLPKLYNFKCTKLHHITLFEFDVLFQSQQSKSAFIQIQVLNSKAEQYFEHVEENDTTSTQSL